MTTTMADNDPITVLATQAHLFWKVVDNYIAEYIKHHSSSNEEHWYKELWATKAPNLLHPDIPPDAGFMIICHQNNVTFQDAVKRIFGIIPEIEKHILVLWHKSENGSGFNPNILTYSCVPYNPQNQDLAKCTSPHTTSLPSTNHSDKKIKISGTRTPAETKATNSMKRDATKSELEDFSLAIGQCMNEEKRKLDEYVAEKKNEYEQFIRDMDNLITDRRAELLKLQQDMGNSSTKKEKDDDNVKSSAHSSSTLETLCDHLIINISQYLLDPIDLLGFSLCNQRIRSILPYKRPLKIKILGEVHNELCLNVNGDSFNTFYVSQVPEKTLEGPQSSLSSSKESVLVNAPYLSNDQCLKAGIHYYFWVVDSDRRRKKTGGQRNEKKGQETKILFLGRGQRITKETPSTPPHRSCRFNLSLTECASANKKKNCKEQTEEDQKELFPPQTWTVFTDERNKESHMPVGWNTCVGLTVGGENTNQFAPDNNNRRVLTTRTGDWNVVVYWWQANERAFLQRV